MSISPAILDRVGVKASPNELERLLETALLEMLPAERSAAPDRDLTQDEIEVLAEVGITLKPPKLDVGSPLLRAAAEYAALLGSCLSVKEAAIHLRIDPSRVRQRLLARSLYGLKHANAWRLPRLQFTEDGLVPGFERLAPYLVEEHPVSAARWFTRPHPDLTLDDEQPISPREWLMAGFDPRVVVQLASELRDVA